MSLGEYEFLFFRRGQGVVDPHWHSGTKVGQGREHPGRQTVCVCRTMPGLRSVSCVLSEKQTAFPSWPCRVGLLQRPVKVRIARADKGSFISHLNNKNPNRYAASPHPSCLFTSPGTYFVRGSSRAKAPSTLIELFALWVNCSRFLCVSFR